MGPIRAVSSVLGKYATFGGVAGRAEYWWWVILTGLVTQVFASIARATTGIVSDSVSILSGVFSLAILVPSLAVTVRRFHDAGLSGKWLLLYIVPVVAVVMSAGSAIPILSQLLTPGLSQDEQAALLFSLFSIAAVPAILAFAVWSFGVVVTLLPSKSAAAGNTHTD